MLGIRDKKNLLVLLVGIATKDITEKAPLLISYSKQKFHILLDDSFLNQ